MYPLYDVPQWVENQLETRLNKFSFSLKNPKPLADAVRKLSNLFIKGIESENYWSDTSLRAAYLSYFNILNYVRASSVIHECIESDFLIDTKQVGDIGCGAGAGSLALQTYFKPSKIKIMGVDRSKQALDEYSHWVEGCETQIGDLTKPYSLDTLLYSYSLNENENWPKISEKTKRLIIIEPSTHQAGRQLLEWRKHLLNEGWYAWAPCTHQGDCPLLTQSGKDWCHHRVHWQKPAWFRELEQFLPMKNDTLTLSYLLLSREKPGGDLTGVARVVGDEQEEKGKTRQMVCQGEQREFLSWLHRDQISLRLHRGELIKIEHHTKHGNELRVLHSDHVIRLQKKSQS